MVRASGGLVTELSRLRDGLEHPELRLGMQVETARVPPGGASTFPRWIFSRWEDLVLKGTSSTSKVPSPDGGRSTRTRIRCRGAPPSVVSSVSARDSPKNSPAYADAVEKPLQRGRFRCAADGTVFAQPPAMAIGAMIIRVESNRACTALAKPVTASRPGHLCPICSTPIARLGDAPATLLRRHRPERREHGWND